MRPFTLKIVGYLTPFLVAVAVLIGIAVYSGEAMPLQWVVKTQQNDPDAIYLPVDRDTVFAYKQLTYQERQPEVVVIGSSRVLNFRSNALNNDPDAFYNAGFSGMRMREIEATLDQWTPDTVPEVLIIGVDQFWFNTLWSDNRDEANIEPGEIDLERVLLTTRRAWQEILLGRISVPEILDGRDPIYGGRAMGLDALESGVGYKPDGSRQTDIMTLAPGDWSDLRHESLEDYWKGRGHYTRGNLVNEEALAQLEHIIQKAKALGIKHVIGFGPPYMPDIYAGMVKSDQYQYLAKSSEQIKALFESYDYAYLEFVDVTPIGGTNQEMADGIHASELLSLRIYMEMVKALPEVLGKYTDLPALDKLIEAAPSPHEVFRQYTRE